MDTRTAIATARAALPTTPAIDPTRRACVVLAWSRGLKGKRVDPRLFTRFHSEPVGCACDVEGFDGALVVADAHAVASGDFLASKVTVCL